MAIRTVVTRGYGNGTFNGTIPLVVRRGYTAPVFVGHRVERVATVQPAIENIASIGHVESEARVLHAIERVSDNSGT